MTVGGVATRVASAAVEKAANIVSKAKPVKPTVAIHSEQDLILFPAVAQPLAATPHIDISQPFRCADRIRHNEVHCNVITEFNKYQEGQNLKTT